MSANIDLNTDLGNCTVLAEGHWFLCSNMVYETIILKDSDQSYILAYIITEPYIRCKTPLKKGLLHLVSYSEYVAGSNAFAMESQQRHGISIAFNINTYTGGDQPIVQYHENGRNITSRLQRSLEKINSTILPWTEQVATAILISDGYNINTNHIPGRLKVHTPKLSECYNIESSSLEEYHRVLTMKK